MKKLSCIALLLLGGLAAAKADPGSQALLTALRTKIGSYTSYRLHLWATLENSETVRGTITISGTKFAARMPGQELYYDGVTLWNYLPAEREVTIETLSTTGAGGSVLSNPARLLHIDPADYEHRLLPPAAGLQVVELIPKVPVADYAKLELHLNPQTNLPAKIVLFSAATPEPIELWVKRIETNFPVSTLDFRFDTGKHPDVEVIDFR